MDLNLWQQHHHKAHDALRAAASARFREVSLFAFQDDVYATCAPERVLAVHRILQQEIPSTVERHRFGTAEESIQFGASH